MHSFSDLLFHQPIWLQKSNGTFFFGCEILIYCIQSILFLGIVSKQMFHSETWLLKNFFWEFLEKMRSFERIFKSALLLLRWYLLLTVNVVFVYFLFLIFIQQFFNNNIFMGTHPINQLLLRFCGINKWLWFRIDTIRNLH